MAIITGTSLGDTLHGTAGADTIVGLGGEDVLDGWAGDDYVESLGATGLTNVNGQLGNDTLVASVPGSGQVHMRGGGGDDLIRMDLTNASGHQGHHAYGGTGADTFDFVNAGLAVSPILGRIDDFDFAQDAITLDGVALDLFNLPAGVDVVEYLGQQWLRIGDTVLYALEGARDGGDEQHFSPLPADITALEAVTFTDQKNFVPLGSYLAALSVLTALETDALFVTGSTSGDLIDGDKTDQTIDGGDGHDVINGGKGDDSLIGGLGDDLLAGGVDRDTLEGGAGDDTLWGGSEDDWLHGGADDDRLEGGTGSDWLDGGAGGDLLIGDGMTEAEYLDWLTGLGLG